MTTLWTDQLVLPTPDATDTFGAALGQVLDKGDVVALTGDLGAGKSALARAAIRTRLGKPDAEVPSPTFTLIQTYEADDLILWHTDLYRLAEPEEVLELGLEDAFIDAASLIEWPDRMGPYLPKTALTIELVLQEFDHGTGRIAYLSGSSQWGARLQPELDRLR